MRDLGKPWFSWADLKVIVLRAYSDPTFELFRKLNDNWRFEDPATYLLSEIAEIESSRRFFEAAQLMGGYEEVPNEYWPAEYRPRVEPEVVVEPDTSSDRARKVADEIRAELTA